MTLLADAIKRAPHCPVCGLPCGPQGAGCTIDLRQWFTSDYVTVDCAVARTRMVMTKPGFAAYVEETE